MFKKANMLQKTSIEVVQESQISWNYWTVKKKDYIKREKEIFWYISKIQRQTEHVTKNVNMDCAGVRFGLLGIILKDQGGEYL